MKKFCFLLAVIFSTICFSQDENSLLWKISGNGLTKDSYLFGTMHVSERIAFHLDDIFFESLMKAEYVALESNPELWLDHSFDSGELLANFNITNTTGRNFYNQEFRFTPPKIREMSMFLSREHYLLNGILYRTDPFMQDFQEDTYLDMFIFQSGRKYDKTIVGLEDIERSSSLVAKATKGKWRKDNPDVWLQKIMKEKDFYTLMADSYRDRNIHLLDSLNKAIYSESYMENMLYIRNEDMAVGIDSIAKLGSSFSAVGAAHLAGEKGVIQKLRDRGYIVTPLKSVKTDKGKNIKEAIENKEAKISYKNRKSSDGFFSVQAPSKLYEMGSKEFTIYLSPNIRNGAYHTVARINKMNQFNGEIQSIGDIDKILFENIPGKIISKKEITKNGYNGLDIVNKTKIGDYQRYQIFLTPLEVIVFKMAGKRDYVLQRGDKFFESISFSEQSNDWATISPTHKGFQIDFPRFHTINNIDNKGNRFAQSYDAEGNYYFVKEVVLNDVTYLEEDDFELSRIHERFYKNMKLTFDHGKFEGKDRTRSYISKSKMSKDSTYTHLKTVINGGFYYLISKIGTSNEEPKDYFDSFKILPISYDKIDFEVKKDTSLLFSVKTIEKPTYGYVNRRLKKKKYKAYSRKSNFRTKTNERVEVTVNKFHDWRYFKNIDSLWEYRLKLMVNPYYGFNDPDYPVYSNPRNKKKKFKITNKKQGKDPFGNEYLSFYLRAKDSLSNRAIKVKKVLAFNREFTLKTLIDLRYPESKFVTEFYNTFQPEKPDYEVKDLFESKVKVFIDAYKKGDSLAIEGYSQVAFEKEDADLLMQLLSEEEATPNQQIVQEYLIKELSENKSERVQNFLDDLYRKSFRNSYSQLAVLRSLAKSKDVKSTKRLLKLLKTDLPITDKKYDINGVFRYLRDSTELSKNLFPDLISFATVDQYKEGVYALLAKSVEDKIVDPKKYKKYKPQLLRDARIALKEQLSETLENKKKSILNNRTYNNSYSRNSKSDVLESLTQLLVPFKKDNEIQDLLSKIKFIDDEEVKSTYITQRVKAGFEVPNEMIEALSKTHKGHYKLFGKLQKINRLDVLPDSLRSKKRIYESEILKNRSLTKKDSIQFVGIREVKRDGKDYEIYFFKVKEHTKNEYTSPQWKLHFSAFEKKNDKIVIKAEYGENNKFIDQTESIEKQMDIHAERFRLKKRKRVNVSVDRSGMYGFY